MLATDLKKTLDSFGFLRHFLTCLSLSGLVFGLAEVRFEPWGVGGGEDGCEDLVA